MGQHLGSVAHDEPGVVAKSNRHVAKLDPALRFPAQELDVFCGQMFGAHHGGGAVMLFESFIGDEPGFPLPFRAVFLAAARKN